MSFKRLLTKWSCEKPAIGEYCFASLKHCHNANIVSRLDTKKQAHGLQTLVLNAWFVACCQWETIKVWLETNPGTVANLSFHSSVSSSFLPEPQPKPYCYCSCTDHSGCVGVELHSAEPVRTPSRLLLRAGQKKLDFVLRSSQYPHDLLS